MNPKLQALAKGIKSNPYEASGDIYHPLPFPEFQDLTTSSDARSAYRKWALVKNCLPLRSSFSNPRVLDIGANAGFYAFNFAKLGAIVDAYEPHKHYATIGHQIVEATGLSVRWYNKKLERTDLLDKQYDIALMLSVFQWISEGDSHIDRATDLLRLVASSSRVLIFELGCNHGKSAIHTEERPIVWIWRLLQQNTSPKRVAYLGQITPWGRARRYIFACAEDLIKLNIWQRLITYVLQHQWVWK
ncbi:MAG: methyltransferase domain-containing protein [Anaerolineales bacterium]|nr:methyltransferase domain-containing protein [Anaerolineales bacterium]